MLNKNSISYKGEVELSTKIDGKIYKIKKYNSGTKDLSKLFASAVLGLNDKITSLCPKYIDVGYFSTIVATEVSPGVWEEEYGCRSDFVSTLASKQSVTGKTYTVDDRGWVQPKMNGIVLKNKFTEKQLPEDKMTGGDYIWKNHLYFVDGKQTDIKATFCFALRNTNTSSDVDKVVAYIATDYTDINELYGSSDNILVSWVMSLQNLGDEVTKLPEQNQENR